MSAMQAQAATLSSAMTAMQSTTTSYNLNRRLASEAPIRSIAPAPYIGRRLHPLLPALVLLMVLLIPKRLLRLITEAVPPNATFPSPSASAGKVTEPTMRKAARKSAHP